MEQAAEARPGVLALMDEGLARPDVAMAICSAATKEGFIKARTNADANHNTAVVVLPLGCAAHALLRPFSPHGPHPPNGPPLPRQQAPQATAATRPP